MLKPTVFRKNLLTSGQQILDCNITHYDLTFKGMNALKKILFVVSLVSFLNYIDFENNMFSFSPMAHAAGLFKSSQPKIEPAPPTVKTLPENTVQNLVVPKDSPFSKLYMEAIQNPNINSAAVNKAFEFLIKNKEGLVKEDVCLGKDNTTNRKKIRNQNCLIIADYTKSKLDKRLHIFKFNEGKIHTLYTAHGKGSNINENDFNATKFSNTPGSLQTSLGFFLTDSSYTSYKDTFGPGPNNGIKLDGISCSTNNARKRYVVVHTAKYVADEIKDNESVGYSEGCVTLPPSQQQLMLTCTGGALVYTHGE